METLSNCYPNCSKHKDTRLIRENNAWTHIDKTPHVNASIFRSAVDVSVRAGYARIYSVVTILVSTIPVRGVV